VLKWLITMVSAMVGLVAAGELRTGAAPEGKPEDVLFLRSGPSVTLIRGLPEGVAVRIPRAVPSTDWSAVVRAVPQGSKTQVIAVDPRSGRELWTREVPGKLEVEVASTRGRLVALGTRGALGGYAGGRSSTTLVIVGRDNPDPRTIELEGNFAPEAFSSSGDSLFVVEYLPPQNPTSYRVRRLDLATSEVGGVYTVDAELQEAMQGTARIQAASPDGGRLYTLYTLQDAAGTRHAFVHVLSLDEEWAHCVDLPPTFGTGSEKAIALAVGPAGKRVYAADTSTGALAEIDTTSLTVTRTSEIEVGAGSGAAHAATGPDGALYMGNGSDLVAVDASTLDTRRSWDLGKRITGIQAGSEAGRLYVGLRDEIVILDPRSGETVGALDPDGQGIIGQLGQSTEPLDEERTEVECAC
jgi:outer membrane protein assembly factor BamB